MTHPAIRKVAIRVVPLFAAMYVFNFMDRVNVGFAALSMNRALGLSPVMFGFGAGFFFVSYFLFEVPSNIALHRFGARIWLSRIAVTWGLVACATCLIDGKFSFYAMRFLLGVVEAGFYPGVVYYLSRWFPARERSRALGVFQMGQAVGVIIGGPLSTAILPHHWLGIAGWRWMFFLEGLPSIALGVVCFLVLRDDPATARWLTAAEREWLQARLAAENAAKPVATGTLRAISDRRTLIYAVANFTVVASILGPTLWMPQFIRALGVDDTGTIGILAALPWLAGIVVLAALSWSSDRSGERKYHVALPMLVCAAAFLVSAATRDDALAYACMAVSIAGLFAVASLFWALPVSILGGGAAASGIAFINSVAMVGGFVGPFTIGWIRQATHSFDASLLVFAGVLLAGSAIVLTRRTGRDFLPPPPPGGRADGPPAADALSFKGWNRRVRRRRGAGAARPKNC